MADVVIIIASKEGPLVVLCIFTFRDEVCSF
jgi:hypothetical protein